MRPEQMNGTNFPPTTSVTKTEVKPPKQKTTTLTRALNSQLKKLGKEKAKLETKHDKLVARREALEKELRLTRVDIEQASSDNKVMNKRLTTLRDAMNIELAAVNKPKASETRECGACCGSGKGWTADRNCDLCKGSGQLSIAQYGAIDAQGRLAEKVISKVMDSGFKYSR